MLKYRRKIILKSRLFNQVVMMVMNRQEYAPIVVAKSL